MKKLLLVICTSLLIDNAFGQELVHNISNEGLDFIKQQESFSASPYPDHKQYSIGYGTGKLCNGKKVTKKTKPITEQEATKHLKCLTDVKNDLLIAYYIDNKIEISQEMHDVLLSFTYNLGSYAALRSSVIKHLINKQCYKAVESLKTYNKASGKVLKGLTNRRNTEAKTLLNGCIQINNDLGYNHYEVEPKKVKKGKKKNAK